jgi:hypothetical protein
MPQSARRPSVLLIALLAALAAILAAPGATVSAQEEEEEPAEQEWAPYDEATVTPGVQTYTAGSGQCTANFIYVDAFEDEDGVIHRDLYIGQSAHCAGTGGATETDGCDAKSQPLGTQVDIEGADQPGTLAYSSWLAMQQANESDRNTCQFNDFALVLIDPADHDKVNPSVPFWGGPEGLNTEGTAPGDDVYSYGNSSLRLGIEALSPKRGWSLGSTADGWNHPVYTATPGIPGDSGSAFLDPIGQGLGSLSTVQIAPLAGSNGVTDLNLALQYMWEHGGPHAQLADGTEPFTPGLPVGP